GLWIDTVQTTHLWDASLTGVTSLAFSTDDGNVNTVDLDIRNTTFDQVQTSQLVFGGTQNVQLTSVQTFDPNGSWWVGMITGGAQVSRYWWLRVNAVDGTGTLLADANVHILLQRLDPNTLTPFTVPNPAVDDIYLANSTTWPVSAPSGSILYRAFAESRTTAARVVNNSYLATGSAVVDLTTYQPDSPASALVTGDEIVQLTFSSLTHELNNILPRTFTLFTWPDLSISSGDIQFAADPVLNNDAQVRVVAHNVGTNRAAGAILEVWEGAQRVAGPVTFDISPGADATLTVLW